MRLGSDDDGCRRAAASWRACRFTQARCLELRVPYFGFQ
jgi:hypothetical protein